VADFNRNPLI